mmetsp:Transcript_13584/g.44390  ORF Transcript_13584/g.44390 Transcript_13584/m.44390 type:complete len:209 (-) Transcript_13584:870-1496(-)
MATSASSPTDLTSYGCDRINLLRTRPRPADRLRAPAGVRTGSGAALSTATPWRRCSLRRWGLAMASCSHRLAASGRCSRLHSRMRPRRRLSRPPPAQPRDGCRLCRLWTPRGSRLGRQGPRFVSPLIAPTTCHIFQTCPKFPLESSRSCSSLGCPRRSCPRRKRDFLPCTPRAGPHPTTLYCHDTASSFPRLNSCRSRLRVLQAPPGS